MTRSLCLSGSLIISALLMLACSSRTVPAAVAPVISQEKTHSQVEDKKGWVESWENLVKSAQKERRVVIYTSEGVETRAALSKTFKEKYGIEVETMTARSPELQQKLFSERRSGLYLVDVYVSGVGGNLQVLKPAGVLDPLEPELVLPELVDSKTIEKLWFEGKLKFPDRDSRLILSFSAYVTVPFAINSELVKPDEIKSYKELLHPKWKGKISVNDPTTEGAGNAWFGMALWAKMVDLDYLRQLAQQELVVLRDTRLQVEWLARGKYPVAIAAKTGVFTDFVNAGAPIVRLPAPIEGAYISSGGGNISLMKDRPHPNAARLYLNWLLTKEGQTVFSVASGRQSRRLDVKTDHVEPAQRLVFGIKLASSDDEEYLAQKEKYYQLARDVFGTLVR